MSRKSICLVSDFFYPGLGGVEKHQFHLGTCLIDNGYKVIMITKTYGKRQGVRYMSNGLKIYYLPYRQGLSTVIMPTLFLQAALLRHIFIREEVEIVHSHQASSTLGLIALQTAYVMGIKTAYTDHSLFGYNSVSDISLNILNKCSFNNVDVAIGVSNVSKLNLGMRSNITLANIFAIPNAVEINHFVPDPSQRSKDRIIIVTICRQTYRKGTDLLVEIIPKIINIYSNVDFIIGGDGDKYYLLEEMRDKYNLHNRVTLLGNVQFKDVRNVLVKGHIFLNTSLTESFCIAIAEAASCGLMVVSTNVGGISEVLPEDMIYLSKPKVDSMVKSVQKAISNIDSNDAYKMHERVKKMYSWEKTTTRVVS